MNSCLTIGRNVSFLSNFTPSDTGWSNPHRDTLLGPSRYCVNPNTLRSASVINATAPMPKRDTKIYSNLHKIMIF